MPDVYDFLLTADQYKIVREHLEFMLESAEHALHTFEQQPIDKRNHFTDAQTKYWRNVASGMRWAIGLAKQRIRTE